jgi:membrane AbrB-like protein
MSRKDFSRLAGTLVIGAMGGALFFYFNMPLAWMMGAMVFTTIIALSGAPLRVPTRLRSVMVAILGVLLGSTFTPEMLDKAGQWPITMASLAIYLAVLTGTLYFYFRRVGRAMGGDDRTIALIHGSRVLLVVLTIPFWFRYAYGVSGTGSLSGASLVNVGWTDFGILLACAVIGGLGGKLLHLPAYRLVGPMLASAGVHIAGLTESVPPFELIALAQVVIGSSVGARFVNVPLERVLKTLGASVGSTALMLGTTVLFAWILAPLSGIDVAPIILAFSPGGLAEMSLIALALGVETAFVASHHVVRIAMIVIAAPLVFRLAGRSGHQADDTD